jgi:hypothetical protein
MNLQVAVAASSFGTVQGADAVIADSTLSVASLVPVRTPPE